MSRDSPRRESLLKSTMSQMSRFARAKTRWKNVWAFWWLRIGKDGWCRGPGEGTVICSLPSVFVFSSYQVKALIQQWNRERERCCWRCCWTVWSEEWYGALLLLRVPFLQSWQDGTCGEGLLITLALLGIPLWVETPIRRAAKYKLSSI